MYPGPRRGLGFRLHYAPHITNVATAASVARTEVPVRDWGSSSAAPHAAIAIHRRFLAYGWCLGGA